MEGKTKFVIVSWLITAAIFAVVLLIGLSISGCESGVLEGVAIGIGTSQTASEAEQLASKKKAALIAEIISLRTELEDAAPEEKAELEDKLAELERKQQLSDLTATIADQVKAGLERDWGERPASTDNLAWILGSAATVLGGYAGKKTLDDHKKSAAITRLKIAAKPEEERKIYEAAGTV